MTENKTKIIITRSSQMLNRARAIKILIDGTEAGLIKNGSAEEFVVAPGEHKVQCKMAWYQSPEMKVDVKQDEVFYMSTKAAAKFYWPLYFLLLVGVFLGFTNKGHSGPRPQWLIIAELATILPFFIYIIYYLSIGRKKYFLLEEDVNNMFAK